MEQDIFMFHARVLKHIKQQVVGVVMQVEFMEYNHVMNQYIEQLVQALIVLDMTSM